MKFDQMQSDQEKAALYTPCFPMNGPPFCTRRGTCTPVSTSQRMYWGTAKVPRKDEIVTSAYRTNLRLYAGKSSQVLFTCCFSYYLERLQVCNHKVAHTYSFPCSIHQCDCLEGIVVSKMKKKNPCSLWEGQPGTESIQSLCCLHIYCFPSPYYHPEGVCSSYGAARRASRTRNRPKNS